MSHDRFNPLDHPFLLVGAAAALQASHQAKQQQQNPAYYTAKQNDPQLRAVRGEASRATWRTLLWLVPAIAFLVVLAAAGIHYANVASTYTTADSGPSNTYQHYQTLSNHLFIAFGVGVGALALTSLALGIRRNRPQKRRKRAEAEFHERWLQLGLPAPAAGMIASYMRGQQLAQVSQAEFLHQQEHMYFQYFQHYYGFTPTADQPAPNLAPADSESMSNRRRRQFALGVGGNWLYEKWQGHK